MLFIHFLFLISYFSIKKLKKKITADLCPMHHQNYPIDLHITATQRMDVPSRREVVIYQEVKTPNDHRDLA